MERSSGSGEKIRDSTDLMDHCEQNEGGGNQYENCLKVEEWQLACTICMNSVGGNFDI